MRRVPLVVLTVLTVLHLGLALHANDGHFVYALDDPYIHLDLADQLFRTGVYGVNPHEVASPSSSILWPFLLGIGVGTRVHLFVPFVLAFAAACAAAELLVRACDRIVPRARSPLLATYFVVALNLPMLVLTGMEQTLQIALTVAAVIAFVRVHEGKAPPRWSWAVIFFAPLVRYECVLVSGALLLAFARRGHFRRAFATGVAIVAALGAFSVYLVSLGLDVLPSSTIVKKLQFETGAYWDFLVKPLRYLFVNPLLVVLLGVAAVAAWRAVRERARDASAAWIDATLAGMLVVYFFVGRFGALQFIRYEAFLAAFLLLVAGWAWRESLASLPETRPGRIVLLLAAVMAVAPGAWNTRFAQGSLRAIYLQQFQMSRLAKDYLRANVAVHDIGLVGYRNPNEVLDVFGLADRNARELRFAAERHPAEHPHWMADLVRAHGSKLVMVYRSWFPDVDRVGLVPVGELWRSPPGMTTLGDDSVIFLAPDAATADEIRPALDAWAKTLPRGARFDAYDAAHPAPADAALAVR